MAVAVEADWPDAYLVNRHVRGVSDDATANETLADFRRFPTWMWRNADMLDFVGWSSSSAGPRAWSIRWAPRRASASATRKGLSYFGCGERTGGLD
jgi:erythromycin esterase-like protein